MKTSELIRWAEDNGFTKENLEEIKESFELVDNLEKLHKNNGIQLIRKVLDYIETPLNEREDEKKYTIETCNDVLKSNKYLTLRVDKTTNQPILPNKFYFSLFNFDEDYHYQRIFTQSEIDNFPSEIKGAIECGFLRKVEVE
jgi:hypothetical protein